jgi:hypothetical protein
VDNAWGKISGNVNSTRPEALHLFSLCNLKLHPRGSNHKQKLKTIPFYFSCPIKKTKLARDKIKIQEWKLFIISSPHL